jgi:elongation factor Ts
MEISAQLVKDLREQTGAGMMDCKKALAETGGDFEKAKELLQKKNKAIVDKKAGRIAAEGLVHSYVHGGRIGVLVEVNCETDFAAKNDDFRGFVHDVAMQIAAMKPAYLARDEIPAADLARQQDIFAAQVRETGKPENIIPKIVEGKVQKWYTEVCLLDQIYMKDDAKTKSIAQLQSDLTGKIGEKISVRRFVRFEVGEGIDKRKDDFASEVAAQVAASQK